MDPFSMGLGDRDGCLSRRGGLPFGITHVLERIDLERIDLERTDLERINKSLPYGWCKNAAKYSQGRNALVKLSGIHRSLDERSVGLVKEVAM